MKCLVIFIFFLAGCAGNLDKCPEYFRNNIGPVRCEILNPISLVYAGYVLPGDSEGKIHLYAFATNDTFLEEAFHSFEIRAGHTRYEEWQRFYKNYYQNSTPNIKSNKSVLFLSMFIPTNLLPGAEGKANLYSSVSHFEDTASCFVRWVKQKSPKDAIMKTKYQAIERFVCGEFEENNED